MCDSTINQEYILNSASNVTPSSTGFFPATNDFAGDYNFEIILNESDSATKKWLYSEKLKKVFIDIDKPIGIQFRWHEPNFENASPKFIRALPVYTQHDHLREPVKLCPIHEAQNKNESSPSAKHVLQCENPGTQYVLDFQSGRRSCVTSVMINKFNDTAILTYKFVCKTSCFSGTQRRPVIAIFTLEDIDGNVLGRRCLSFKVCSCLKRDLHREEDGLHKKKTRKGVTSTSEYFGISPMNVDFSSLPSTISMNSIEMFMPCTLRLRRLKRDQVLFALKTMHDTILGEYMRSNIDGLEDLIMQLDGYLFRI